MTALLLLLGLLLLAANGFFVAAEFALVAARRSRMQELAANGRRQARIVLALMSDLPRTLASTQLGITIASIGLGFTVESLLEAAVVPVLERSLPLPDALLQVVSGTLALGTVVAAHTVLGEIVPKNLAIATPERSALVLAPPVRAFTAALGPAVRVLTALATVVLRLIGVEPRSEVAADHGLEGIEDMLRLAAREGAIGGADRQLLDRALRFADRTVEAVMIPWREVTAITAEASRAEAEQLLIASGHTRLPVLREGEVLGFVNILDLQRSTAGLPLHPVLRVAPSCRLVDVFEELRHVSGRLAVVMDDAGRPAGIVTLEDLLEELLGGPD
jgi:CBS domain containing-hemolysin-like protein